MATLLLARAAAPDRGLPVDVVRTLLALGLYGVSAVLLIVVAVGLRLKGPTRWVKICTVALTVTFFAATAASGGFRSVLVLLGLVSVSTAVAMTLAILTWSTPRMRILETFDPSEWPTHAIPTVDRWSRECTALGLRWRGDRAHRWRSFGSDRRTFIRFFDHPSEPLRVEITATDNPKGQGRSVISRDREGAWIETCDQGSDMILLPSPRIRVERAGRSAETSEIVEVHRRRLAAHPVPAQAAADPIQDSMDQHDVWIEDLRARGVVTVKNDDVRLPLRSVPTLATGTLAMWFH